MSIDPRHVLQDTALAMDCVFRSLPHGPRKKLDVQTKWGDALIQWRAPDQLGIDDQSVLLAVLEVAMAQVDEPTARIDGRHELWAKLGHEQNVFVPELVRVVTSYRQLARLSGYSDPDGGRAHKLVKASLKRLAETTVWVTKGSLCGASKMLGWDIGNDNEVLLALNWRLTQAMLRKSSHASISNWERSCLGGKPAKALHALLSCQVNAGAARRLRLERLQRLVWGEEQEDSAARRQRRLRLKEALADINRLPGWSLTLVGRDVVRVKRASPEDVARLRESTAPGLSVTRCVHAPDDEAPGTIDSGAPRHHWGFEVVDASAWFLPADGEETAPH